jgi:hypothetical protein
MEGELWEIRRRNGWLGTTIVNIARCTQRCSRSLSRCFLRKQAQQVMACNAEGKKPYHAPMVRKLSPEQAKLLLNGRAMMGDPGAKDLLEVIYREPVKMTAVADEGAAAEFRANNHLGC